MKVRDIQRTLSFIIHHPLTHGRLAAVRRYASWQIGSRLLIGPVAVPFVEGSWVLASRGMTGITGVVYCGLPEFDDMGFALHVLREDDLMVDVGANVGVYTILGAAVGARVVAFEPVRPAAERLWLNVQLNGFDDRVELHQSAVGSKHGRIAMTSSHDSMNHVVREPGMIDDVVDVELETIDHALSGQIVSLLKVDVEGWEVEVLRGAEHLLRSGSVRTAIIEMNGSGRRYGIEEQEVDDLLRSYGYQPYGYDPLSRQLSRSRLSRSNVIYLEDEDWVSHRLADSPRRRLADGRTL